MDTERDPSDLGLPQVDDLTSAERRSVLLACRADVLAGRAEAPVPAQRDSGEPTGRKANARQRAAAIALARRSCGWQRPSARGKLRVACERCGAGSLAWCRKRGRAEIGHLCTGRGES